MATRNDDILRELRAQKAAVEGAAQAVAEPSNPDHKGVIPAVVETAPAQWQCPPALAAKLQPFLAKAGLSLEHFIVQAMESMPPDFPELRWGGDVLFRRGAFRRYHSNETHTRLMITNGRQTYRLTPVLHSPRHEQLARLFQRFERNLERHDVSRNLVIRQISILQDFSDYRAEYWTKRLDPVDWEMSRI